MKRDPSRRAVFTRRALLLAGGQVAALGVLAAHLYRMQVTEGARYATLAESNRVSSRLMAPPRGRILDRFGTVVAGNRLNWRALLMQEGTADLEATLDAFSRLLPLTGHDRTRIARDMRRQRRFVPVVLRDFLSWEEMALIEVNAPALPGVSVDAGTTREYPFGPTLAHVVGYVAPPDERDAEDDPVLTLPGLRVGRAGMERHDDLALRGRAGVVQVEVNALGRVIRELDRQDGTPGQELRLTVDAGLQQQVLQRLGEESASAVVLDARNGEVMAMATNPSFDPALFNAGVPQAQWAAWTRDRRAPLTNKAVAGLYPPGSTFKMVVGLAALEARTLTPGERIDCPGYLDLGDTRFHCWRRGGHGKLDLRGGLKNSCDVFFYEAARRTGIDRIAAMARRFGLGVDPGIELPEARAGLVPTREWRVAQGHPWNIGDTVVHGIGQGFLQITPLALATMAARLATGRAVQPHLIPRSESLDFRGAVSRAGLAQGGGAPNKEDTDLRKSKLSRVSMTRALDGVAPPGTTADWPDLGIPEASLRLVREGMRAVVNETGGTAPAARLRLPDRPGVQLAGKTGSSQVRRVSRALREGGHFNSASLPWQFRPHALFVCFAPCDAPRYAAAVVVEHGNAGADMAAPIARDIMAATLLRDPAGRSAPPGGGRIAGNTPA